MAHNDVNDVKCTIHDAEAPLSKQCHVESSMDISTVGTDETLSSLLVLPAGPDWHSLLDGKQSLKPVQPTVISCSAAHKGRPDVFEGSTDRKSNYRMLSIGTPVSSNNLHPFTTKGKKSQNWLHRTKSDVLWQSPVEFKSFFSEECDDIANQLRSKAEGMSGNKRKLDVSLIEDEPPPFFSTPLSAQDEMRSNKRKRMDVSGSKRNLYSYFQSNMSSFRDFILKKPEGSTNVSFRNKDVNVSKDDRSVPPSADSIQSWASVSSRPFENLKNSCETYWKKLAPIKEVSLDAKDSYAWRNKNYLNSTDVLPALYHSRDEQHTKSEYNFSFNSIISAECDNLIEKLKKTDLKFDHKNSLIEKSSMLEESLLDLEKMNLNLLDFNSLDETNSIKAKATCNFQANIVRSGKSEGVEKGRNSVSNGTVLQLPVTDESSTEQAITRSVVPHFNNDLEIEVTSDPRDNAICTQPNAMNFLDPTGDVKSISQSLFDGSSMQNNFSIDKMTAVNICEDIVSKSSNLAVVDLTKSISPNSTGGYVANVTYNLVLNPNELAAVNVTQDILSDSNKTAEVNLTQTVSNPLSDVTQEMVPNPRMAVVNVTQEMVPNPRMAVVNVTQEMVPNPRMAVLNVTQEMVPNPRMAVVNVTQEMVPNPSEKMAVSVTKDVPDQTVVMHLATVSNQSGTAANVLKDLVSYPGETAVVDIRDTESNHNGTVLLNLTKDTSEPSRKAKVNVHDPVSKIGRQSVAYTSMDLALKSESIVINVTQDLVSEQSAVAVTNATQDMVSNEGTALNGTKDRIVGSARMKTNCVGATSSITQHVLMNSKLASNKQMNEVTSMNRRENEFLPPVNSLAARNPDQVHSFPVTADQITEDSSECLDVTTENEVRDGLKQSATQPEKLELWDTALDYSALSNSSLSFVTSTPVAGFSNYHFISQSGKPMQDDPFFSFSTIAPQAEKELKRPLETKRVNKGISKGSMLPRIHKNNVPVAKETRQIPSLGRGFLPHILKADQKLIKAPVFTQIQPSEKSGSTIVRPALGRTSLPRSIVTSVQKNTGKSTRPLINHKRSGSTLKTPETGVATVASHAGNFQVPKGTLTKKPFTTVAQEPTTKIAPLTARPKTATGCRKDFGSASICPPLTTGSQISHRKGPLRSGLPKPSKKT